MQPTEHAVRQYIDAWLTPDRTRRAQLLAQCFAVDGRVLIGDQVIRGRAALAASLDARHADPRRPSARRTHAIDADGATFRVRVGLTEPDGQHRELIDFGEVDGDGRIATLFTFHEPLAEVEPPPAPASSTAWAAQRYVDLWTERDPIARRAQLAACFVPAARLVARRRSFCGLDDITAMIEAALADPRGLLAARTSAIDVAGTAFRFATLATFADGSPPFVGEDAGELASDGRIAVIYLFADRVASPRPVQIDNT